MDFGLFSDVARNSDNMEISGNEDSGFNFTAGSPTSASMLLALNEGMLSSFEENKPLQSSSTSSSECFYFIPELNTTCSLINTSKHQSDILDNDHIQIDDKLFFKNEEDGIWVVDTNRSVDMEGPSSSSISTGPSSESYSVVAPPTTRLLASNQSSKLVFETSTQAPQSSLSPREKVSNGKTKAVTSRKRKQVVTPSKSSISNKCLRDEFQLSKTSASSNAIRKAATKAAGCKITPDTEKFFTTLADSVTQQISNIVRQEVQNAVNGLKALFNERFPSSSNGLTKCVCQLRKDEDTPNSSQNTAIIQKVEGTVDAFNRSRDNCNEQKNSRQASPRTFGDNKLTDDVGEQSADVTQSSQLNPSHNKSKDSGFTPSDCFEQSHAVSTLPKCTSAILEGTLKKSMENYNSYESQSQDFNPVDVLNMSFGSLEADPNECNEITYTKFSLDAIKEEPFFSGEDESSQNYLELFTSESSHFLDQQEVKQEKTDLKVFPELVAKDESCTALVPYVPASPSSDVPKGKAKPERVPKPELSLRKYKKPLLCEVCDRTFLNNSSLKQHLSFHRPQRPYKCEQTGCGKSYKTRSELNRHLIVHSGEKNYECRKCGKAFLRKQYLKTHLIRHNEGLTWQCHLCAKIFVCEEDLKKHNISYHKNGKRSSSMIKQSQKLALTYYLGDTLAA